MIQQKNTISKAFYKTVPVMAGYIVLGTGFGILLRNAGYLGRVLPQAIIGLLVIYCLKDISLLKHPYGAPELIAGAFVIVMQAWKRNAVLSILAGTIVYMILIRVIV